MFVTLLGSVYLYSTGHLGCSQQSQLLPNVDVDENSYFGIAVDMNSDTIVAGSTHFGTPEASEAGCE